MAATQADDHPLVVFTDTDEAGVDVGASLLEKAGFRVRVADCHTEEDVIQAGRGAVALLPLMAPVGRRVFEALPDVRLVATNTVGFDSIDIAAAAQHGVWVANVPDSATEEVAVHAFSMALALLRQLPFL